MFVAKYTKSVENNCTTCKNTDAPQMHKKADPHMRVCMNMWCGIISGLLRLRRP